MAKASRQVLFYAVAVSVSAFALTALAPEGTSTVAARALVIAPRVMPLGLPDAKAAKAVLSASLLHHHPQWIDVPTGASVIRTFVIYPDRSGRLPVAVVTDQTHAMSDWVRASCARLFRQPAGLERRQRRHLLQLGRGPY